MATNKIELYNFSVKFPTDEDVKKWGYKMAHLVYATPHMGSIIEYAGRTCYKSFNNMNSNSHKNFISAVVSRGHESVIEHSNLVYVVFKKYNKAINADSDNINRYLITLLMYNGLLNVTENQGYYLISGNLRMFKDLVREFWRIREKNDKRNPIIEDIAKSFYTLPSYLFIDMIKSGHMDETKFVPNPKYEDCKDVIDMNCLNDYVSVINHDNFTFKIRGFATTINGTTHIKRLNTPNNILRRHNRMTVLIKAPRYITHQLVRHRLASYSQASQRYILEEGNNEYMPQTFKDNHVDTLANNFFKNSNMTYSSLIEAGVPKEDARAVLTNAAMSTVVMTATINEFDHFIELRADKAAQNFIRDQIAIPLKNYLENYYKSKAVDQDASDEEDNKIPERIVIPSPADDKKVETQEKGSKKGSRKPITKKKPNSKTGFNKPIQNKRDGKQSQKKVINKNGNVKKSYSKPANNKKKNINHENGVKTMKTSFTGNNFKKSSNHNSRRKSK